MNTNQQPEIPCTPSTSEIGALLDALAATLRRFVVLPKWAPETLALWILHTYVYELREVSTYIGLESPEKRCGKTTLLSILNALVNRPVIAANISPPALFRVIEELHPTLLIDEADTFLQGNEELRGILNSGYTRSTAYVVRVSSQRRRPLGESKVQSPKSKVEGRSVPEPSTDHGPGTGERNSEDRGQRTEDGLLTEFKIQSPSTFAKAAADKKSNVKSHPTLAPRPTALDPHATPLAHLTGGRLTQFSCWCPKVISMIGRLPETLADRCIVITMHRKSTGERCERLRNLSAGGLRRRCARFAADHARAIRAAKPKIPVDLNDRAADVWDPLLALADVAGGRWPALARDAATALSAMAQESSPIGALLWDVLRAFSYYKAERLFSRNIIYFLGLLKERPWHEAMGSKKLNELWLAHQLRPYGIHPKTLRAAEMRAKGYERLDLLEVWLRYVPDSQAESV
ncbi:MAG: hypothetical protein C5B50_18955 [Verrucomicrobia bacterium]|nr:MAG: hypothetical protein C5B50_18955 [Verrucomicrobiota bacterium]